MQKITTFKDIVLKNIVLDLQSVENEEGKLSGMKIAFKPVNEDMIYHKSDGQPIMMLDKDLAMTIDIKSLIDFNALLLETQSSYLFNLRSKVFSKDIIEFIDSKLDDKVSFRVRVSRHFFREEEKGRYKISIAVLKKNSDNEKVEVVNINLTKRDVLILSSLIRKISSSYHRSTFIQTEIEELDKSTNTVKESKLCSIVKIDNALLIDNIWLHGQELLNVMHSIERLSFKLNIEKNLSSIHSVYRQIIVTNEDDIAYFKIKKLKRDDDDPLTFLEDEEAEHLRIPISGKVLSYLYMFLDINVLRHADYSLDRNVEFLNSTKAIKDKKIRFHISMKESTLGIGIKEKLKDPLDSKIILVGKVKEGQFKEINEENDILDNYIKIYDADNNLKLVPVLTSFDIDLKDQYTKFIAALSKAYTRNYVTEEREQNIVKFYVINQNEEGRFKYQFHIFSDINNKAPAVLIIDKYKTKKGEDDVLIGRFRQPLFEKYVFQLMTIMLTASEDIEHLSLLEEKKLNNVLKYQYKSLKKINKSKINKEIVYGIKKDEDKVVIGNFTQSNLTSELIYQDVQLINISSYFRLTMGYWIPFVGEKISIGQDGYLTDMFGEINMEDNNSGEKWASKMFFCTSF